MKILPKHTSLRPLTYWIMGIGILLCVFLPYAVAFSFRAQSMLLLLASLLIFTPLASQTLPMDETNPTLKRRTFAACFGLTLLLQITLILAFYSISHLTAYTLPVSIESFPLFETTLPILLWNWGAFPWGIYVLMAVALGYTGYINKQPTDMSTLLRPIIKNKVSDTSSLTIDVATKLAILLTLASTLGLVAIECVGVIGKFFDLPVAYGPRIDIFLTIMVVFQWSKGSFIEEQLGGLLKHRVPAPAIAIGFLLSIILILLGFSSFIGWLSPILTPRLSIVFGFAPTNWPAIWGIFSGIWWLGWAPLVAAMLAYVWRGYTIRSMIICTLLLPITAGVLIHLYPNWQLNNLNTSLWNLLPALLSLSIIIWLFLRTQVIGYAWKARLPVRTVIHQGNPKLFLKLLFQGVIIMMGLYWVGGIYVPGVIFFAMMYPVGIFGFAVGITVLAVAFKKRGG